MKLTAKIHQKCQKLAFPWLLYSRPFHGVLKLGMILKILAIIILLHHYNIISSHLPSMEDKEGNLHTRILWARNVWR